MNGLIACLGMLATRACSVPAGTEGLMLQEHACSTCSYWVSMHEDMEMVAIKRWPACACAWVPAALSQLACQLACERQRGSFMPCRCTPAIQEE